MSDRDSRRAQEPDDRPLRLDAAAVAVFGAGAGITGRSLARAARLVVYRINGKTFTTLADVRAWVAGARVPCPPPQHPASPENAPPDCSAARARAEAAIDRLRGRS